MTTTTENKDQESKDQERITEMIMQMWHTIDGGYCETCFGYAVAAFENAFPEYKQFVEKSMVELD